MSAKEIPTNKKKRNFSCGGSRNQSTYFNGTGVGQLRHIYVVAQAPPVTLMTKDKFSIEVS
jgi:hypothetical protein